MKNLLLVAGNNIGCVSVHAQRIIFCSNENRYNAVVKCNINLKSSCRFMSGGFFSFIIYGGKRFGVQFNL